MATIYAIANGNWGDGSTWSTGTVPTVDDDVYMNGHNITADVGEIFAKNITNDTDGTAIAGGRINSITPATLIINANLSARVTHLVYSNASKTVIVYGNTIGDSSSACAVSLSNTSTVNVYGDVYKYSFEQQSNYLYVTIYGNVYCNDGSPILHYIGGFTPNWTINGSLRISSPIRDTQTENYIVQVNGDAYFYGNFVLTGLSNRLHIFSNGILDIQNSDSAFPFNGYFAFNNIEFRGKLVETVPENVVLEGYEYGYDKVGTLQTLSNVTVINLTEDQVNRATNCVTNDTLQATMEDYFGGE